jgi:hypothetical protein
MAQGTTRGVPIDTDPLLANDSDLLVPSQKAVKAYAQPQLNGTGFVKATGTTISYDNSTYLTSVGTGVTNELTYWSGTNSIASLATATYPSLTELSYVKGVTSAIQTQLNTKGYTLGVLSVASNLAANQTYYFGNQPRALLGTATNTKVFIPKTGTIKRADITSYASTTAGTAQNISVNIRLNNTTDTLVATVGAATAVRDFINTGLSIAVVAGDYIEIKVVVATPFTTPPAGITFGGTLYIE